ncbi:MAG: hypothetical protein R3D71_05615 [Rickettsiales bacterium]
MSRFAAVVKEKSKSSVVLYKATSRDGNDFYAYIRCDERQYHKMKRDFMTRTPCRDVSDYGEVIYIKSGQEPDDKAKEFLAEYLDNM